MIRAPIVSGGGAAKKASLGVLDPSGTHLERFIMSGMIPAPRC